MWDDDEASESIVSPGGGAISVSLLTQHLSTVVRCDEILQDIWVRGEVSNFTRAASGHLYFTLKDEAASLSCVMWRGAAGRVRFRPEPGMQLLAHGRVSIYAPRGQYQLDADDLQPDGTGALHLAFEQLKATLQAEGLFSSERKRALPRFPRTVAVVTSLSGAAVRDICTILRRDPKPPRIILVPAQVQGEGAEQSISAAMALANSISGADVIIVGRGGGSLEDLWAFNTEGVVRAIAASQLPVISAVGHETDISLADLVADVRAPTPTAAAELVAAARREMLDRWQRAMVQVIGLARNRVATESVRWHGLTRRMPLARPDWLVATRRQRLDELSGRLARTREALLAQYRNRLEVSVGRLEGVSPLATLARGYAVVTRLSDGIPVSKARTLQAGEIVSLTFQDGAATASIVEVQPAAGTAQGE